VPKIRRATDGPWTRVVRAALKTDISFYGAAGFVADGAVQVEFGVRAIRMVRS